MTFAVDEIMGRRGTTFELDRSRRDALATYAQLAASDAGKPAQTWVRETWGFKVYEAKHLLAGNASEVMWERILKGRGPHTGWCVALPILGAIIGSDIAEYFSTERQRVAHERARYATEEARITALEDHARRRRAAGSGPVPDGRAAGGRGVEAARVGRNAAR